MTTRNTHPDVTPGKLYSLSADCPQQPDPSPRDSRQPLPAIAEHLSRADSLLLEVIREIDRRKADHGDDRLAGLRAVAAEIRSGLTNVREAVLPQASEAPGTPQHSHAESLDRVIDAAWEFTEQCWAQLSVDALDGMAATATECVSQAIDSLQEAWQHAAGSETSEPSPAAAEASDAIPREPECIAQREEVDRQRRRRRSERRAEQKAIAASWPDVYRETLQLQTGLVRRQLSAGDAPGAMEQAAGILEAFVRAVYASQTGSISRHQPIDVCLARLRTGGLISEEDLFRLLGALRLTERARRSNSADVAKSAAGNALSAVELIAAGYGDAVTAKERRRMKRSIRRRAERAVAGFNADPAELHFANIALTEATAEMEGATDAA